MQFNHISNHDFAVGYSVPNHPGEIQLTHRDIAFDLYQKVQANRNSYADIANILRNLYYDFPPLHGTSFNHTNIYYQNFQGISIPCLVSNIKWIALQEDINHPPPSWGKKLTFCRYFEAIYAALDNQSFNTVSSRINNRKNTRPTLWGDYVYHIQV